MELFSVHKPFQHPQLGEEKQQMLGLNRRLETYLSRVKHLEEENMMLAEEIQALRRSNHGALSRRRGLEEELQRGRQEVEAAWRDRVYMEMDVERLVEELRALDLLRQKEAQAQLEAKAKLERSRKELEEEQRAQMWLRDKVSKLENEMRHLIRTHEDDMAHFEAKLTLSRSTVPPTRTQRNSQTPNLLDLGQEFSQRATRAWQEVEEAYQGQLAQLEETLNQTRSRLNQVNQERSEGQMRLQALEREIASAQEIRSHLEKTVAQQGERYDQEIQQLQEHLEGLEAEKEELGQQIEGVLLENHGLLQAKMSLGLEVSTYRALLDGENLRGNVAQRNTPVTDPAFCSRGVKTHHTQLSTLHKTTSLSSVRGRTESTVKAAAPVWSRKPVTCTPKTSLKSAPNENTPSTTLEPPYPKILQDGAVENFRPQEVQETVTYAEPLSPPNEREVAAETPKDGGEDWSNTEHQEEFIEPLISHQVESGLEREQNIHDEGSNMPNFTPYSVKLKEELGGFSEDSDIDVPLATPEEKPDTVEPFTPFAAWQKTKSEEHLKDETSDSETEAIIEPNVGSRTSSPVSECEHDDGRYENVPKVDVMQEIRRETEGENEGDVEDKLYPDGEEMDTWDSVIERKVDPKDDSVNKEEEKLQHAEPEEDISAREQKQGKAEILQQKENTSSSLINVEDKDGRDVDVDKEDEDEDSQNVSISWRTELEGDSYAQDNTLADTRPLIRYKSDETDGNTHASHMDESESSEGEQEKKAGEAGAAWGEGKSKRFGTMEDLCEEGEGEALNEDYDLGYTQVMDERDVDEDDDTLMNAKERAEELFRKVREGNWDVGDEDQTKPMVDYDEELETDRLVEQELEDLATDSYSAHFALKQSSQMEAVLHSHSKSFKETGGQETEERDLASSTTSEPLENLYFTHLPPGMPLTDELVQHEDLDAPEQKAEEHHISMLSNINLTGFENLLSMPDHASDSKEPQTLPLVPAESEQNLQEVATPTATEEDLSVGTTIVSQEGEIKYAADSTDFPEAPDATECDILETPFDIKDQTEGHEDDDEVPKLAESPPSYDKDSDDGFLAQPLEISPITVPEKKNILEAKDSEEILTTNGKDKSLHGFFSSGLQSDLWTSSLETGAAFQPDDAFNEAAEQTNKNQGNADSLVWGDLDKENMVYKDSGMNIDSAKAFAGKAEQKIEQGLGKNVLGEFVHSEGSDIEGGSWSSGEEAV